MSIAVVLQKTHHSSSRASRVIALLAPSVSNALHCSYPAERTLFVAE
jgi:hypothetical protein